MGRGFQGAVLKLLRAGDYRLRVLAKDYITDHYLRLTVDVGGLFEEVAPFPTQWVRLWIPEDESLTSTGSGPVPAPGESENYYQRGYTLIRQNTEAGTADIEFALHDGGAAWWAVRCEIGDELDYTVMGSKNPLQEDEPDHYLLVGDPASLPAISALLESPSRTAPAAVYLEYRREEDKTLPVPARPETPGRRGDTVTWCPRSTLVDAVAAHGAPDSSRTVWVACDTATTRAVKKLAKDQWKLNKQSIHATAYWLER